MFVKDTFTGASAGSNLTAHTGEIGATWTKHPNQASASLLIDASGRIYGNAAVDNTYYASGVPASANYSVYADVIMLSDPGAAHVSVCGRISTSALTYYRFALTKTNVYLQKYVAGVLTTITSGAYAPNEGQTYRIGLHMSSTTLKATIDGAVVLAVTDASISAAGRIGTDPFGAPGASDGWHIDNVWGANGIFWVGGSGTVASSSHWSRLPAGSSGITPTSTDDAIVDQNAGSPTITVDVNQTFASFSIGTVTQYVDTTKTMTLTGSGSAALTLTGDLSIYGDAGIGSALSNITITDLCVWRQFSADYIPRLTIASANGVSCDHTILGIIQCNVTTLMHNSGLFTMPLLVVNDKYASLNVGTYDTTVSASARTLVLGNSVIGSEMHVSTKFDLSGSNLTIQNLNKLVVYFDGIQTVANLGTRTLAAVHVDSGRCTMATDVTANSLILEKNSTIVMSGSCTFGYIAVASNLSITIAGGKTLTGRLVVQNYGEEAKDVGVMSGTPGVQATWNMLNGGQITKSRWRVQDIQFINGSVVAYHSYDAGNNNGISFATGLARSYRYAVYDYLGNYIDEYTDVVADPNFNMQINAVPGQLTIRREVDPTDFGEGTIVNYDNRVEITCFNDDHPNGKLIYQGTIDSWTPNGRSGSSYVDIVLVPYSADLAQYPVTDPSFGDVSFIQDQPKTLLSFTSSKVAVSWTTGSGVLALGQIVASIYYANTSQVTVSIYKDNGSNTPDNTVPVYTTDYTVDNSPVYQGVYGLNPNIAVSASSKYWLVVDTHGGNVDQTPIYTTNDYASGNAAYWNGSAWVQSASYGIQELYTYTTNADTSVSFAADDWKESLFSILRTYSDLGGRTLYSDQSIEDPGITFTYDFNSNTMLDAVQKFVDQCPTGWYWYVDAGTNELNIHPPQTLAKHRFTQGVDVQQFQLEKTKATIVNSLYITGGDTGGGSNLFRNYISNPSIGRYRRRTKFYNDINLVSTTASDAIGEKILGQSKDPVTRGSLNVLGTPEIGADLEALAPGDLFVVLGKDDELPLVQISGFSYLGSVAEVDASTAPAQINNALNDTQVAVRQQQTVGNPAVATVVEVL